MPVIAIQKKEGISGPIWEASVPWEVDRVIIRYGADLATALRKLATAIGLEEQREKVDGLLAAAYREEGSRQ